jgi:iron(III) transport system substrate-binding protein
MTVVGNAGLFAPVAPATLAQVGSAYRQVHSQWVGIAARATVFAYDQDKLKPADLPKSLLDLAQPQWKGRWGVSPAGANFQAIVSALLASNARLVLLAQLQAPAVEAQSLNSKKVMGPMTQAGLL